MFSRRRNRTKAEWEYRHHRLAVLAPYYGRALVAVAMTIPVGVTTWLLQAFAGKQTSLNVTVAVSASLVANVAMAGAVRKKTKAMNEQSAELNRLRGHVAELQSGIVKTDVRKLGKRL